MVVREAAGGDSVHLRFSRYRYNGIISTVIFILISLFMISRAPGFDYQEQTFSRVVYFISPELSVFYSFSFVLKACLDYGFFRYVCERLSLKPLSPLGLLLLVPVILFGVIGFFPANVFVFLHKMLAITIAYLWLVSTVVYAKYTQSRQFMVYTVTLLAIQSASTVFLSNGFMFSALYEMVLFGLSIAWIAGLVRTVERGVGYKKFSRPAN